MGQFCHLTKKKKDKNNVFNMISSMEFCLGVKQPKKSFQKDNKLSYRQAACLWLIVFIKVWTNKWARLLKYVTVLGTNFKQKPSLWSMPRSSTLQLIRLRILPRGPGFWCSANWVGTCLWPLHNSASVYGRTSSLALSGSWKRRLKLKQT